MTTRRSIFCVSLLGFLPLIAVPLSAADIDELQRSFDRPPDDCRIMMRWWWFGPAVTKPELEREINLMREGGIGGFEVQPTYPLALDDEKVGIKNLKFMSPEFLDMLAFTAEKAKQLGLRMDLTLGSGWPYGGPQFPLSQAAGRIRTEVVKPNPGQTSVPLPKVKEGEQVFAAFLGPLKNAPPGETPYKQLEIRVAGVEVPSGIDEPAQVTFFISSQTKMKVKRAAYGAEGYVIDHYNPAVIEKFIKMIAEPAVAACGPNPPYAVFCDSLEVAGEDWTADFLGEFQRRRGYDLRPLLPALYHDIGSKTLDIRHDWGKTLTELFNDYFISAFEKWANRHDSKFRLQGYGTPPAALYSYSYADLCEGEGYTWKGFRETRWASSASHLLGRPVTSSETWTWLHSPVFMASPLDIKAEANLHFLQGINQLIGHGWPYSPPGVEYPGWRFYASGAFNEKNPWWIVMPDLAKYLQRVSFIMRQGHSANDVALYLANSDAWASFVPGRVAMNTALSRRLGRDIIRNILESGYNLDFFDDQLLESRGKVADGELSFGDVKFKVVVLAGVERIPPSTLRKLDQFARSGGILIATRTIPSLAPGYKATEDDQQTVRLIADRLFRAPNAPGIFLESESDVGPALAKRLPPDVAFDPPAPEFGFVHRSADAGEIYFLTNTGNVHKGLKVTFRTSGLQPEIWDLMTGRTAAAPITGSENGRTSLLVDLAPYQSKIVMFTDRRLAVPPQPKGPYRPLPPEQEIDLSSGWNVTFGKDAKPQTIEKLASWTENPTIRYFSGVAVYEKKVTVPAAILKPGFSLQLTFGQTKPLGQSTGTQSYEQPNTSEPRPQGDQAQPNSPAESAQSAAQGNAQPSPPGAAQSSPPAQPLPPPTRPGPRMQALIEAPVREAAIVYINGKRTGSLWSPPYTLDVTGMLKPGENQIRIEVANLAVNYMADFKNHPLPDYKALIARFGDRFQPQDMNKIQPVPSGLIGPVRLIAERKVQ